MHVVYETLPHQHMKFRLYFVQLSVCKFECVSEFFHISRNLFKKWEKLTNTFKLAYRNEQNTNKTSYSSVQEFHTLPAHSEQISYKRLVKKNFGK